MIAHVARPKTITRKEQDIIIRAAIEMDIVNMCRDLARSAVLLTDSEFSEVFYLICHLPERAQAAENG